MPTRTKIDAARSILNLFSKIRILRVADNIHDGDRWIPRGFRHPRGPTLCDIVWHYFSLKSTISLYTRRDPESRPRACTAERRGTHW